MFLKGFTQQVRKVLKFVLFPLFASIANSRKKKDKKEIVVSRRRFLVGALTITLILGISSMMNIFPIKTSATTSTTTSSSILASIPLFATSVTESVLAVHITSLSSLSSINTTTKEQVVEEQVVEEQVVEDSNFSIHIYDIDLAPELQRYAYEMSQKYPHLKDLGETGYLLMLSTAFVESNYDFDTISATNDYGAYQINISNHAFLARDYNLTDMLDPYHNTQAAAIILNNCLEAWNSWDLSDEELILAVANSYNMGVRGYQNWRNGGSHYARTYGLEVLAGMKMLSETNTISDDIRN